MAAVWARPAYDCVQSSSILARHNKLCYSRGHRKRRVMMVPTSSRTGVSLKGHEKVDGRPISCMREGGMADAVQEQAKRVCNGSFLQPCFTQDQTRQGAAEGDDASGADGKAVVRSIACGGTECQSSSSAAAPGHSHYLPRY